MWDSFMFAFNAVMPMLLLMSLGYVLKEKGVFDPLTLKKMNFFGFKFCMGTMAFNNVYKLKNLGEIPVDLMFIVLGILVLLTGCGLVLAFLTTKDDKRRGILVQSAFRSNYNVVGLSLTGQLGGQAAMLLGFSLMAPTVLYFNIVAVIVLSFFGQGGLSNLKPKKLLWDVATNSIIVGLTLALLCLAIRGQLPLGADGTPVFLLARDMPWLYGAVEDLARITSPLMLVLLGATVNFAKLGNIKRDLTINLGMRLILAPVIGFSAILVLAHMGLITLNAAVVATFIGVLATPLPVVGAPMAIAAGCDADLASQAVVWSTALSMFSMMFIIMVCRLIGML